MENRQVYDLLVVGGGPGGYTAALYAARAGLSVAVLEKLSAGGQMGLTQTIDNYPGFPEGVDGFELGEKMQQQAERFGAVTEYVTVEKAELRQNPKAVYTDSGVFYGRTVAIATGANPRKLGLDGEDALVGKGVAYCAACDGHFYKGKTVVVVGGGNSAAAEALHLSRVAKKVYVVHRRDSLRADKVSADPLFRAENVEFVWNSTVTALPRADKLTGVTLKNLVTGEERHLTTDGLFISVGRVPVTDFLENQLVLDGNGYIVADETTKASVPGVFAVGDVRTKALRQIVTAVSDGAAAAHFAQEFSPEK
jgi:thioredoxin reductase (NADPH)